MADTKECSNDPERTIPWTVEELLFVNGFPLVYTVCQDGLKVRIPGRKNSVHIKELYTQGATITMPSAVRR